MNDKKIPENNKAYHSMKFKKILVMGILSFLLAPKAGAQTFSEACYTPGLTRFQLFAPDNAKQVTLRIYDDG